MGCRKRGEVLGVVLGLVMVMMAMLLLLSTVQYGQREDDDDGKSNAQHTIVYGTVRYTTAVPRQHRIPGFSILALPASPPSFSSPLCGLAQVQTQTPPPSDELAT